MDDSDDIRVLLYLEVIQMNTTSNSLKNHFDIKYAEYKKKKVKKQFIEHNGNFITHNKIKEETMINIQQTESLLFKYLPNSKKSILTFLNPIMIILLCTITCIALHPYIRESNLIMIYLLGVTIVALMGQMWPAIIASIISVLVYDFFFIPPIFSFSVLDIQNIFTLVIMLIVAQIISHLTIHVRRHTEATRKAQTETEKERFRNILLTSVSHDLRTPLTAIMGSASSILQSGKKLSEDTHRELAQNIYDESERLII